jgi:hypothetical protein
VRGLAAAAIAVGYGLAVAAVVARGRFRRPWLLAAFAAGALLFPLSVFLVNSIQTLIADLLGWDVDSFGSSLGIGIVGALIAAAINEILKLAVALLAASRDHADQDGTVYGAAVGAGFGAVGAYQIIAFALIARGLQIGTPENLATPLVQQLGFVAVNAGSTALAAYGATRGGLVVYLLAAIAYQTLYGLLSVLFSLELFAITVWTVLSVVVGLALLACAVGLSARPAPAVQDPPP